MGQRFDLRRCRPVLKMGHFIPCRKTTVNVASLFFREIYRLHKLPISIAFDRYTHFLTHFWRSLWHLVDTRLDFRAYYLQTDGQTKIVNRSLGNLLSCLVDEPIRSWYLKICQVEFAHNHVHNRSIGYIPTHTVFGFLSTRGDNSDDDAVQNSWTK